MKRFYWIMFIDLIGLFLVEILGSYLDAISSFTDRWISLVLVIAYVGITYILLSRKTPVTLTEEEKNETLPERQDFSHASSKPNWKIILFGFFAFIAWVFIIEFAYIGLYKIFLGAPVMETVISLLETHLIIFKSITWWIVIIGLIVSFIIDYRRKNSNKYIIDGDTLIIQENRIFKTEEELRIPLDTIDEVYIRYNNTGNGGLYLSIQGITRRLNTGQNSLALGKAILQHKQRITTEK